MLEEGDAEALRFPEEPQEEDRMMTLFRAALTGTCLVLPMAGVAFAQEDAPTSAVGAGVGVIAEPYAELDDDLVYYPVPVLNLFEGRLSLWGTTANVRLYQNENWEVAATGKYRVGGYDADDSPVFVGMEDREATVEAGGKVTYDIDDTIYLSLGATHDVLDEHGGFEVTGQASYALSPWKGAQVTPLVGVAFRSEDMSDYYYGVDDDEALVIADFAGSGEAYDRYAYAPGETMTPYMGISYRQAITRDWAVFLNARHEFLPDEVEDSPLVDDDGRTSAGIALARLF